MIIKLFANYDMYAKTQQALGEADDFDEQEELQSKTSVLNWHPKASKYIFRCSRFGS
jgi:hypothetical protein